MSIIVDDPGPALAHRLRTERDRRKWSLADLAARADVSKAMLSKVERQEVSPTANVLLRIATAFGLTLAELLTLEDASAAKRLVRFDQQPTWRDPETSYVRRQVFIDPHNPLELVEVTLPRGASISFPTNSYEHARHVIWVLSGKLTIIEGQEAHELNEGDRLQFGAPGPITYRNTSKTSCRYLVTLLRT